jgi:hypothetical protein
MGVEGNAERKYLKIHLVGLPLSTHRRLEAESDGWIDAVPPTHDFRSTPLSTNEHTPFTNRELKSLQEAAGEGFTHVVIPGSRDWQIVQSMLQFDCRVHIARLWEPIRDVPWSQIRESLHRAAELDEVWLGKISPRELRHPLLLPPKVFQTGRNTHEYWKRCDVYAKDLIPVAEELLTVVDKEHRTADKKGGRSWIDARKLRYRIDHSKHGRTGADRSGLKSYRFCYEVPPGFHYDVTDENGRTFSIPIDGKPQNVSHCNISPWGHIRKG